MGGRDDHRIEYLDWLRALAAGLVLFGHAVNQICPGGAIGVSVFFVLSGFLITSILLREGMLGLGNVARFIVRRLARIYPMYVFLIALVVAGFAVAHRISSLGTILQAVPGLLTFTEDPSEWSGYGFAVLWTLSIEFWFYVTFPFVLWAATSIRQAIPCIFAAMVLSLAAKVFGFGGNTLHYYDHFLIGSLCAALIKYQAVPKLFERPHLFALGIGVILLVATTPYPGSRGLIWFCQSLTAAAATGVVILAGFANPPARKLPWAAFLGRISYSVYLMHAIIFDIFIYLDGMARNIPLFLAIVIPVSTVTYYVIERPIERLAKLKVRYKFPAAAIEAYPAIPSSLPAEAGT